MMRLFFGAVVLLLLVPAFARAEIVLTNGAPSYSQDFNTLASSGSSNTAMPTGWYFSETGSGANATYAAWTASSTTGNTYSFGVGSGTDRSLGTLQTSSLRSTIGARFKNDGTTAISAFSISYFGEQWRMGAAGRVDLLNFQYSANATSLDSGMWIDVDSLDAYSIITSGSPTGYNGNNNGANLSGNITGVSVAPGSHFWIRWTDFDASGADDGLAVDDFVITADFEPAGVPEPASTAALVILGAGGWVARRVRRRARGDAARG